MSTKTIMGACPHDCPDTCSMIYEVEDDKVLSVRGNPEHPFTKGRLCVKMNNFQDTVHSQERLLHPMRRIGPKGNAEFERISWDEALNTIATRWKNIIAESGPQAILPYSYLGTEGILNGLNTGDAFFNKMGATVSERTFCDSGSSTAYAMTIGDTSGVDPESFVHSKYIILWACNTLSTNSHHWPFIQEGRKNGAKLVVVDPFRSRTAQQADWHIRIKPGTDAALAMGMMNIIIQENLVDKDYVDNYTVGYDELAERVSSFTVDKVSKITGIAESDILTLTREYATHAPAVIRIGVAIERHAGGGQTVRALACLPALVGSWRKPGGGLLQLPIWVFPVNWGGLMRPEFLPEDVRVINQFDLGKALAGDIPSGPPIRSLCVYNSNPITAAPDQDLIIEGLMREDLFTVVSERFMTDTARYADIVLPATTQAEQEDIMFSWGHFYISYNNRAIEPMGDSIPNTELFRRLAKVMGYDDEQFTRDDHQMVKESILWESPMLEGVTLEQLKKDGYARLNIGDPSDYAPHAEGNFPTPSGKCEFKSSAAANGNFVIPLFRQGYEGQQRGEAVDPLPHYIPPNESVDTNAELAKRYPLSIMSPKSHAFVNSSFGNLPHQLKHAGEQTLIIHPADADERQITNGATIRIMNDRGSFQAKAEISEDAMPGLVVAPFGYWQQYGSDKRTVQAVNSTSLADLGGAPTFSDNLVNVEAV